MHEVVLGRLTTPYYFDETPHWPNEYPDSPDRKTYPHRCRFEIVKRQQDLNFSDRDLLSMPVVEALKSSVNGGRGKVALAEGSFFPDTHAVISDEELEMTPEYEPRSDLQREDIADVCRQFAGALIDANLTFGAKHNEFVRTFVVSLATKGLVLLTGLSGSGKTRIAMGFGQWLGPEYHKVIAVRPDWTGPEPLLGYEDALLEAKGGRRSWNVPEALEFMLKATRDPQHPYLLILDEMNLAHVERYFADLLSGMESGSEVLPNLQKEEDGYWRVTNGTSKIPFPRNLFVVGTVNIDETTYMFSPKVLDRANTIEFRVDSSDLRFDALKPSTVEKANEDLVQTFLAVARDDSFHATYPPTNREEVAKRLVELHELLARHNLEFGHRTFYESMRFTAILEAAGETNQWTALDMQVKQKVLPRMHGSARKISEPLNALAHFCASLKIVDDGASRFNYADVEIAELPESFDKVRRMTNSLRANQFTSFSE